MNGISLVDVRAFFRWYFSQIPFVTANAADIDKHFFGFNYDEKLSGEAKELLTVIAGLSQKTHTGLEGDLINHGSAMGEPMWLDVSVVKKVDVSNYEEEEAAFDACKNVLNDFLSFAQEMLRTGGDCDYPILKLLDLNKISGAKVVNAGGSFYGWRIRIYLHSYLDDTVVFNPVTAPPIWNVPEGSIPYFAGGIWTHILASEIGGDVDLSNYYTKAEVDALLDDLNPEETDPIFTAHAAFGITPTNISNWNTAFGWGNHAGLYAALGHTHSISDVTGLQTALDDVGDLITDHIADNANPHQTTLEQARSADNFFEGEVDMNGNRLRNLPTPTNADEAVRKDYVDTLIDTTIKALEGYDPTGTSLYPVTYNALAIQKGDSFKITVNGTVNGIAVKVGDFLIALTDTPAQTDANWMIGQTNVDQATESTQGIAKIATQANAQDEFTSNNTDILTPQKGWYMLLRFIQLAWTWTLKQTFTAAPRFNSASPSQYLKTDANKDLTSVAAIPATDITEDSTHRFVTDTEKTGWDAAKKGLIAITINGNGGVINTGQVGGYLTVPFSGTITGWDIFSTVAATITLDTWKSTYAAALPTVGNSIWGTKPNLAGTTKNTASGLNIAVTAGDVIAWNVDSNTSGLVVNCILKITKTA